MKRTHSLTPRQLEVSLLVAQGFQLKEAAVQLNISVHTASHHLTNAREALGAKTERQFMYMLGKEMREEEDRQ